MGVASCGFEFKDWGPPHGVTSTTETEEKKKKQDEKDEGAAPKNKNLGSAPENKCR